MQNFWYFICFVSGSSICFVCKFVARFCITLFACPKKPSESMLPTVQHIGFVSASYLISSFINEKLENSISGIFVFVTITLAVDLSVTGKSPICEKRPKQSKRSGISGLIFL